MCGIVGFINNNSSINSSHFVATGTKMVDTLTHRGPDGQGLWVDETSNLLLGHRRLSIIDISLDGHQPMLSASGRFVIVFNGEIYNFQALRDELSDYPFRGYSDTEVILASISKWGIEQSLKRFNGMWACAIWDRTTRTIYLSRDRLGKKPLYFGWLKNSFVFASELKAFREHPDFEGEIDRNSLALMMRHNNVPSPHSIYKNIYKLPPGTLITLPAASLKTPCSYKEFSAKMRQYWSINEAVMTGKSNMFIGSDNDAITTLDSLLKDAVQLRMEADVPLGALLSGGIDSSLIVALMQLQSKIPVKTFSIGFSDNKHDEAVHAKAVAKQLGTEHTELYISAKKALDVIPRLSDLYDEPFADSSQIPTFLISEITRQHVTVSLAGDGGDELFGGYPYYIWVANKLNMFHKLPSCMTQILPYIEHLVLKTGLRNRLTERLSHVATMSSMDPLVFLYNMAVCQWKQPSNVVVGSTEPMTFFNNSKQWVDLQNPAEWMMYMDTMFYLPNDILVKVDRASMGTGLEIRAPLLDHRVLEFAWQLPLSMKIRNRTQGKWILKQLLYRYVDKKLVDRPKQGFSIPLAAWLRNDLKDWAESLLDEKRLREEGFFNTDLVKKKWKEHLTGKRNWHYWLWNVLMFQAWLQTNKNKHLPSSEHMVN